MKNQKKSEDYMKENKKPASGTEGKEREYRCSI